MDLTSLGNSTSVSGFPVKCQKTWRKELAVEYTKVIFTLADKGTVHLIIDHELYPSRWQRDKDTPVHLLSLQTAIRASLVKEFESVEHQQV